MIALGLDIYSPDIDRRVGAMIRGAHVGDTLTPKFVEAHTSVPRHPEAQQAVVAEAAEVTFVPTDAV